MFQVVQGFSTSYEIPTFAKKLLHCLCLWWSDRVLGVWSLQGQPMNFEHWPHRICMWQYDWMRHCILIYNIYIYLTRADSCSTLLSGKASALLWQSASGHSGMEPAWWNDFDLPWLAFKRSMRSLKALGGKLEKACEASLAVCGDRCMMNLNACKWTICHSEVFVRLWPHVDHM